MLRNSSKWELGLVHCITKFTISRFEILPYLKKKAAAYSTDKKAWFDNLERWGYFFFLMYVVGLFHLWWTENLIQGFEISRQTKHTILLMLTGRFLSCLAFCIFAFLLLLVEYFEYLIELQIFAGIVVGMFVVILCRSKFFYDLQVTTSKCAGMYC